MNASAMTFRRRFEKKDGLNSKRTLKTLPVRATYRPAGRAAIVLLSASLIGGVALGTGVAGASASTAGLSTSARLTGPSSILATDWPAYLDGPLHHSYSPAETAITPATVPDLQQEWQDGLGGNLLASPTVVGGSVYIGSSDGWFYKLSEATGSVLDKVYIGRIARKTCGAMGVVSTATVAIDPASRQNTVYVAGPDGYLYALRAYNLSREWRSVIAIPSSKISDYFDWSSPTVANGKVYVGVASQCDRPLVRGAVIDYQQATGKKIAEFYTVPKGSIGGSVWSSIGVGADGDVYATTGNGPGHEGLGNSESILKLSASSLTLLGRFQVPAGQVTFDGDFGSSPVIFGSYVGACNKNGIFYLLSQSTMKVAWEQQIGLASGQAGSGACLATPTYNGTDLFFGGNTTTTGQNGFPSGIDGSVQARAATSGALVWETVVAGNVLGSPTLDGGGVIAAGIRGSQTRNGVELLDASTGSIIEQLVPGSVFAQSVFADNSLFCATDNGLYAFGLKGSSWLPAARRSSPRRR